MNKKSYAREFDWCRDQIIQMIVKPLLISTIQKHNPSTMAALLDLIEQTINYRPNPRILRRWLNECDITMEQTLRYRVVGREEVVENLPEEDDLPERIKTIGTPGPTNGRPGMTAPRRVSGFYDGNGGVIG